MKEEAGRERECEGDWMKKGRGEIRACVCVHLSIGCNQAIVSHSLHLLKELFLGNMNEIDSFGNWTLVLIVTGQFDPFLRFPILI